MFDHPGSGRLRVAKFGIALLMVCAASEAIAKPKVRKPIFDDLVTPSMLSQTPAPRINNTSQPRFFSINGVLAKLDGKTAPSESVRVAAVTSAAVVSDIPESIGGTASRSSEPYGLLSFRAPEGALWRKWRAAEQDIARDAAALAACVNNATQCDESTRRFNNMIGDVRGRTGRARIEAANRLVNGAIRYTSDLIQHGVIDQWSAPLATLASSRGDCEDYAIAKYVLLREAGVPHGDLRILLGRDKAAREDHAVLAVKDGANWIILDNRTMNTSEDMAARHFVPLFAIDKAGVSLFASPYLSKLDASGQTRLSPAADGEPMSPVAWGELAADLTNEAASPDDATASVNTLSALPIAPLLF